MEKTNVWKCIETAENRFSILFRFSKSATCFPFSISHSTYFHFCSRAGRFSPLSFGFLPPYFWTNNGWHEKFNFQIWKKHKYTHSEKRTVPVADKKRWVEEDVTSHCDVIIVSIFTRVFLWFPRWRWAWSRSP